MRRSVLLLLGLVVLGGAAVVIPSLRTPPRPHGTLLEPPMEPKDFQLLSREGPVGSRDFRGRLVVLAFGYTSCPDVCPTTLARLASAMDGLGEAAREIQVLLITVDPERDTPARVGEYAAGFDPSFVGLSGTPEQIAAVTSAYGIYHAKAPGGAGEGGHEVNHAANVLVLGREGGMVLLWRFDHGAEAMAADLRYLLERG